MLASARYAEIRFNDRPIKKALADPEAFVLEPGRVTAAYEQRSPWRLDALYPNIADYRVVATDRFFNPTSKQAEEDWLWNKVWLIADVASDLRQPGDWFRFDIDSQSIIVARAKDDRVTAFHNVCKHRGNRLVDADFGHGATSLTCLVHSWRYDLTGRNVRVTDRETFSKEALCQSLDLTPVHVRVRAGLVFVSTAESPAPFEEYYGDVLPMLESYRMDEMFVVKDLTVEIPANWKTMVSVFSEVYHAHATHPQTKPFVDEHFAQYDFY